MFNNDFFDKLKSNTNIDEFYKILMNSIPDGLTVTNTEGKIEFVTQQTLSLFRLDSFEDAIGKNVINFIVTEDKTRATENISNIFKGIYATDKTYRLLRKDGSEFYGEIVTSVLHDENKNPKGLVALIRDISERKATEFKLREKDEQFQIVVREAPVILFIIDSDGIFELSEGKGLEKLGVKPGQVVGISAFEVYHDFPVICKQVKDALNGKTVHDILHINDTVFDIIYNPLFNKKNKVTSLIGIAVDITERYKTELALRESEEKFKTMFTAMSEGVAIHELIYDAEGKPSNYRIIDANPSYENHTGIKFEDTFNKLATELYGTDEPPYINEFSNVVLTGKSYRFETYFPPMERYFRISVVSLGKNQFATVFGDISAYKKYLKEINDKNEELERFTYTVSHDLKSPLVTIKGFIGMISQDIKEGKLDTLQDDMRRISSAAEKMGDLLNDLLELSRVGRIINAPTRVSMRKIIDETLEILEGIISTRNIIIKIHDELPEVMVDKQRIAEVWQNLIENAIKFSKDTVVPNIEIGYSRNYREHVFFIKDNGIGIDPNYHDSIFGLFNKLENKTLGTGIGLALVRRIIDVHGGRIWVESEGAGKGSVFKFTLPEKPKL